MKKYLREKKKWVSAEEYDAFHSAKKKASEICHGKTLHDFVLILPNWGVKWDGVTPYNAEAYYDAMDEIVRFEAQKIEELKKNGILASARTREPSRQYVCSICKKNKYSCG